MKRRLLNIPVWPHGTHHPIIPDSLYMLHFPHPLQCPIDHQHIHQYSTVAAFVHPSSPFGLPPQPRPLPLVLQSKLDAVLQQPAQQCPGPVVPCAALHYSSTVCSPFANYSVTITTTTTTTLWLHPPQLRKIFQLHRVVPELINLNI